MGNAKSRAEYLKKKALAGQAPLVLSQQDRDDLNVGAMVFRVPPYHQSEQSKRIAALMDRIAAHGVQEVPRG